MTTHRILFWAGWEQKFKKTFKLIIISKQDTYFVLDNWPVDLLQPIVLFSKLEYLENKIAMLKLCAEPGAISRGDKLQSFEIFRKSTRDKTYLQAWNSFSNLYLRAELWWAAFWKSPSEHTLFNGFHSLLIPRPTYLYSVLIAVLIWPKTSLSSELLQLFARLISVENRPLWKEAQRSVESWEWFCRRHRLHKSFLLCL